MAKFLIDLLKKIIIFLKRFLINTEDMKYDYDAYHISMKSQRTIVLEHLEEHGSITAKEGLEKYGIHRMSAVIFDLRKKGHIIATERIGNLKFVYQYMGKE
jgi:hypothetical protein